MLECGAETIEAAGVTEMMYAPAGSDVVQELEALASVVASDR
jgi:hypothetical protein